MRYPWANILLLLFILADMLSGFFGLISGSEARAIYIQVHRVSGYGILAVLAWKVANIARSFKWPKKKPVRIASLALALVLVMTLALGLVWSIFGDFSWWMFSGLSWHIYAGVVLAPLLLWHGWYMFRGPPISFWAERRSVLRLSGLAIAGFVAWQLSEGIARAGSLAGSTRRFTGSYEAASFSGNDYPVVSWLNDRPQPHQPRHLVDKNLRRSGKMKSPSPTQTSPAFQRKPQPSTAPEVGFPNSAGTVFHSPESCLRSALLTLRAAFWCAQ